MFSLFLKFNLRPPVICKIKLKRRVTTESKILELLREMPQQKHSGKPMFSRRCDSRLKFRPSNVVLKVIGNGAVGSPRSVFLFTDTVRYLFNCGEGSLRLVAEAGIKLSRLTNILVTYPSWDNIGGLINIALSLKEAGALELCIHGQNQIETVYSNANKFVSLRRFIVTMKDCPHNGEFSDEVMDIKYVHLYPSTSSNVSKSLSDQSILTPQQEESESENESKISEEDKYYDLQSDYSNQGGSFSSERLARKNKYKHSKKNKRCQSEVNKKKLITKEEFALSYICRTKPTLGTLLVHECMKLGVPPGPALGKLKKGEDITLENGTIVKSSDVKEPDIPGAVIIFVECPTEDYLDSLLKEPAFCRHQSGEISPDDIASVVVHFTCSKVLKMPKYQEWISRFCKETKHLYINEDNRSSGSLAVHRMQYKLNMLQPDIFPLLMGCSPNFLKTECYDIHSGHSVIKCLEEVKKSSETNEMTFTETVYSKCESNPHIVGETFSEINIRPMKPYDYTNCLILKKDKFLENIWEDKSIKDEVNGFKLKLKEFQNVEQSENKIYPKIVFLGTGSSKPSLTRNTSGIIIFPAKDKAMILDCGESTYNQLVNLFGKEKSDEILRNVKLIYISHMHADHHTGLITLLKKRKAAFESAATPTAKESSSKGGQNEEQFRPVFLMAPVQMTRWLHLFNVELETIADLYHIIPNSYLINKTYLISEQEECLKSLNLKDMKTTHVLHCPDAFGVAITHEDGWKLTYSGDTLPCSNLVNLGMNSDILIHEATHDDSLILEAERKMHSTTSQAIQIGKEMNAKYILLTHFSQRYSHVPLIGEEFQDDKVGIAFDNMIVNYNQLPLLSKLTEALKLLFAQRIEKLEERQTLMGLRRKLMDNNCLAEKRAKVSP